MENPQPAGSARLFQNKYLDRLSRSPRPIVIWLIYMPFIIFLLAYAFQTIAPITITTLFGGGVFAWTLFEYLFHRFVFHFKSNFTCVKQFIYTIHGCHHHYPKDATRLMFPPAGSLLISSVLMSIFYLLLHMNILAFAPGFMFGYLIYDSMHYAMHMYPTPPFQFLKPLWKRHYMHHYVNDDVNFGISSSFWDYVFRTKK